MWGGRWGVWSLGFGFWISAKQNWMFPNNLPAHADPGKVDLSHHWYISQHTSADSPGCPLAFRPSLGGQLGRPRRHHCHLVAVKLWVESFQKVLVRFLVSDFIPSNQHY